jgi:hypothetical protein
MGYANVVSDVGGAWAAYAAVIRLRRQTALLKAMLITGCDLDIISEQEALVEDLRRGVEGNN